MSSVRIFAEAADLHQAAGRLIVEAAARAIAERGRFLLVLAGGTTPRGVYRQLAAQHIEWERVHLFWGDERGVPPEHAESNFRMAAESLLRHLPVPPPNLHRIPGEKPPGEAALLYDRELQRFFGAGRPADLPGDQGFDLVLLGIGADGHTASLFPGSEALEETGWAAATQAPSPAAVRERITLTLPAINCAREVVFLVTGREKRAVLQEILLPAASRSILPACRVAPRGTLSWFLDAAAAPPSLRESP